MFNSFLTAGIAIFLSIVSGPLAAHSCTSPEVQSNWISTPTVVPFQPEFSRNELRWRVKFRVHSIGTIQGLVSYDEWGQADAGHTTLIVDALGRILVRRQDANKASFFTRTHTKVVPGRYYNLLLESSAANGTRLLLDGVEVARTSVGFGTENLRRPMVLGASCVACKVGTSEPLQDILDGEMTFTVEDSAGKIIASVTAPENIANRPNSSNTAPATVKAQEPAEVSVSLRADHDWVNPGAVAKLHWTSNGADECVATGAWGGRLPLKGARTTATLESSATFGVRCSNGTNDAVGLTTVSIRQAELEWLPPTQNEDGSVLTDLAGYKVHWGPASGEYSSSLIVREPGQTRQNIPLPPGNYFFGLTAYNSMGTHSKFSNERFVSIE